jgi:hypothetical protein
VPSTDVLTVGTVTATTFNGALNGNASTATKVTATTSSSAIARYLAFVPNNNGTGAATDVQTATALTYLPSSGMLMVPYITATTLAGALSGNASSATQVSTIRNATNINRYIIFSPNDNASAAASDLYTATALVYNPSAQTMTVPNLTVSGTLTGTVGTCTNIAGGAGGSVLYQSAAATTAMLSIGAAGTQLRSTGTVPSWATPGGFCVNYAGNVTAAGMILCSNLPFALVGSATLNSTLGTLQNVFVTPYSGIIVAASGFNATSQSTATATVHVNGSATALITIAAGQFTATAARTLTLSSTTQTVAAGSTIEVRVNTAVTGNTQITLYIA